MKGSRDALAYVEAEEPGVWSAVAACGEAVKRERSLVNPDRWKYRLTRCGKLPWCTYCVQHGDAVRTARVLARFEALTPNGELPRFLPAVQTAALNDSGTGWGGWAARHVAKFRDAVWKTIRDVWPGADGAFFSYQDFGEQGFSKQHPHLDFTVNGWAMGDDGPQEVDVYELRAGGFEQWWQALERNLPAAVRPLPPGSRGFDVVGVRVGATDFRKLLAYKVRELIDLRKLAYEPDARMIGWTSYKTREAAWLPLQDFQIRLAEYEARLGAFGRSQHKRLHVGMGAMADRGLEAREAKFGGRYNHREDCTCQDCNEWQYVGSA